MVVEVNDKGVYFVCRRKFFWKKIRLFMRRIIVVFNGLGGKRVKDFIL